MSQSLNLLAEDYCLMLCVMFTPGYAPTKKVRKQLVRRKIVPDSEFDFSIKQLHSETPIYPAQITPLKQQ